MKRLLTVTLSAMLALALTACGSANAATGGEKKDAKTIYQEAVKKNKELKSMDMTVDTKMKMKSGGESMDMDMKMDIKMDEANTDKMVYAAKTVTVADGETAEANVYFKDGYCYTETAGQKFKYKMSLTDIMSQVQESADNSMEVDMIKELNAKQDGDNQILTFTADPAKMDAYVQEALGAMGTMEGMEGLTMTVKSASGEYTINKEGYYTNMKTNMEIDMTMEGQTINMNIEMTAVVNNPGQKVEVALPSLDDFQEIDASAVPQAA